MDDSEDRPASLFRIGKKTICGVCLQFSHVSISDPVQFSLVL
jgi:hypothetical protein